MFDSERQQLFSLVKFDNPTIKEQHVSENHSIFTFEPLVQGYGTTLGNSLRRVLMNSIPGAAVSAIRIPGVAHEFSTVSGMKEDVCELVLNIKGIVADVFEEDSVTGAIEKTGPCTVTAGDIASGSGITIVNPEHYLCTLSEGAHLSMTLVFSKGVGYFSGSQNKDLARATEIGTIYTDSIFTPITNVAYASESARVGSSLNHDKLTLDVTTNGSITPGDAVMLASKILISHYALLCSALGGDPEIGLAVAPASQDTGSDLLSQSIDMMELSVRSYNSLKRSNINTIGELCRLNEDTVGKLRNLGAKSLEEIKEKLMRMGLSLRSDNND